MMKQYLQPRLRSTNGGVNRLSADDRLAHDWYRFVLSFPPHLVREYLQRFDIRQGHTVLDPFCGTGTTIVECKKLGIPSIGIEANPLAHFASKVKVDWSADPEGLLKHAGEVADLARERLQSEGFDDEPPLPLFRSARRALPDSPRVLRKLSPERERLLLANSISPLPLHKTLVLLECLDQIRNDQLLTDIAESLGYEPVRIELFRTRLATATREQLREEVVILRWPGAPRQRRHARAKRFEVAR
jgi:hypothetical protein